jgi:hypothetical protein
MVSAPFHGSVEPKLLPGPRTSWIPSSGWYQDPNFADGVLQQPAGQPPSTGLEDQSIRHFVCLLVTSAESRVSVVAILRQGRM